MMVSPCDIAGSVVDPYLGRLTDMHMDKTVSQKLCVFCGKCAPDVKMSKEHVLRAYFAKFFPGAGEKTVFNQRFVAIDGSLKDIGRSIPNNPFTLTANDVCKPCNEGWLNTEVEVPAQDVLLSLMFGRQITLDKQAMKSVALWGAKTAVVRGLIDAGERVIPQHHYRYIKENLAPPPGTFVWAGFVDFDAKTFTRHLRFSLIEEGGTRTHFCHVTTLVLGNLALFVLGNSRPEDSHTLQRVVRKLDSEQLVRVWPESVTVNWPLVPMPLAWAYSLSRDALPEDLDFEGHPFPTLEYRG